MQIPRLVSCGNLGDNIDPCQAEEGPSLNVRVMEANPNAISDSSATEREPPRFSDTRHAR